VQLATAKDRLLFLDAARGIAALMVVLEHGLELCWPAYRHWSLHRINFGQIGVLLFFVISGFIIPASLNQGGSQARFWLRRFFRLFPLYWTVIACAWLLSLAIGCNPVGAVTDRPSIWLVNLTMLQGFVGVPHALEVFWTLQFELLIYLVSAALFASGALKRPMVVVWLVLGFDLADGLFWHPVVLGEGFAMGARFFRTMAPFFGVAFECYLSGRLSRTWFLRFLACFFGGIPLLFAVNSLLLPQQHYMQEQFWRLCGSWLFSFGGFALLVAVRDRFQPGALAWLGRVSYSVYLVHPLVLAPLCTSGLPTWTFLPLLFAGTLALSALTFQWIEQPGILLGRALENRWLTPLGPRNAVLADVLIRQAQSKPTSSPWSAPPIVPPAVTDIRRS
jgi:peptidoglycan/LPS O-acetylase OafA/YrhL